MKRTSTRRLGVEQLESRDLMAGNMSVKMMAGNSLIAGDNAANRITITQFFEPRFRVTGQQTTLNGKNAVITVNVRQDVRINIQGGNDQVRIGNSSRNTRPPRDLFINMSGGRDLMSANNAKVRNASVKMGGGNDRLKFAGNITIRGVVTADGGAGHDEAMQALGTDISIDPDLPHKIIRFGGDMMP